MEAAGAVHREQASQPIRPQGSRLAWVIATGLYLLMVALIFLNQRTGVALDPAITNPAVQMPPVAPASLVQNLVSPARLPLVLLVVWLAWLSIRQHRLHRFALIAIGSIATGLLDPLANWATVASLSPRQEHFPTDWPWFNLAPLAEPTSVVLGAYTTYYLVTSLLLYWLVSALLLRKAKPSSWVARHPQLTLFSAVYILSFPLNMWLQVQWMKAGVLLYTQFPGPILDFGGHKLPLLIQLYDPFVYAAIALLCLPNADGESKVLVQVASALPGNARSPRTSSGRQAVAAALVLVASFMVPIGSFCLLRLSGIEYPVIYDTNPFPETKVYDPFGDLERAGKTGPFQDRHQRGN
jgi:hypothetical protein